MTLSWSDPEPDDSLFDSPGDRRSRAARKRDAGHAALRGWLNALGVRALAGGMHRVYGRRKRELFADLPDTVVELGPGPGTNFRYYRPGTRVIAVEPSPHVRRMLRKAARRHDIQLELHPHGAESLDLDDASVDAVVATLVLCTVGDPREVLSEVRRVLRPGGRFIFVEHVSADPGTTLHRIQGWLRRPWSWAFAGCELRRNTGAIIRAAGFDSVDEERFRVSGALFPFSPHVAGVARR